MKSLITAVVALGATNALETYGMNEGGALDFKNEKDTKFKLEDIISASNELKEPVHKDIKDSGYGAIVETSIYEDLIEKVITFKPDKWANDPRQVTDFIKEMSQ
jgi:hypothetical protein